MVSPISSHASHQVGLPGCTTLRDLNHVFASFPNPICFFPVKQAHPIIPSVLVSLGPFLSLCILRGFFFFKDQMRLPIFFPILPVLSPYPLSLTSSRSFMVLLTGSECPSEFNGCDGMLSKSPASPILCEKGLFSKVFYLFIFIVQFVGDQHTKNAQQYQIAVKISKHSHFILISSDLCQQFGAGSGLLPLL